MSNFGFQDAHNLAWKLAFVLNHHCSDALLDTYYDEREPVATRNLLWSIENAKRFVEIGKAINSNEMEQLKIKLQEQHDSLNYEGLDLGYIYHSKAIHSEHDQTISISPSKYLPTTLPGSRAPYVKLIDENNKAIATLDLFEKEYVLLVGSDGYDWQTAGHELAQLFSLPLNIYRVGNNGNLTDPDCAWQTIYEITAEGAVLIRPDGHVAWRSTTSVDNPKDVLSTITRTIILMNCSKRN